MRNATWRELVQEAGKALFDSLPNLDKKDVDSLFVGAAEPERFAFQAHAAPMVGEQLGVFPSRVIARTELACASGQAAIRYAYGMIATGMSDIALCLGVEKMNLPNMAEAQSSMTCVLDREWEGVHGASAPPFFALCMQRHMKDYGTTREQVAQVSVKNHHFSTMNPYAQFQKEFTIEKIVKSFMVSPPLTLFDCSGITDGAAGVIMASEEKVKELNLTDTPVYIKGSGQASGGNLMNGHESLSTWEPCKLAAKQAYQSAGITADDIDVAEVHDCFTISEIIEYEDLGFCEKGSGGKFIEDGQADIGGKVAVNTRGGLLGMGHPLGATGISQAIAIMEQLRGEAPKGRAVDGAKIGLTHNLSGSSNVHSILIYGRDA
ncbi:MAG: 3-ketoacyl-CoA thiolase [Thermoplasmata archaeon]|nr:MAG: 3-ketoacyl-CoA thiolase [Thermoplasmata archaeon]